MPINNVVERLEHGSSAEAHLNYFAVPLNARSVTWFFARVRDLWRRTLRRRSQRAYMNWEKMRRLVDLFFPPIRIDKSQGRQHTHKKGPAGGMAEPVKREF